MARGRMTEAWNHTSQLLALTYNVNRDPKKTKAATPADFHPLADAAGRKRKQRQNVPKSKDLSPLKVFVQ